MKTNKNRSGKKLLKNRKIYSLTRDIIGLALTSIGFGGIMTAIGLDTMANASPEIVITTVCASACVGIAGAAFSIATEIQEKKQNQQNIEKS